jgi:hypothetical protein
MHTRDVMPPIATAPPSAPLEREERLLRERLAFYEGFDALIQDNVAHARELFRLAAQERETATAEADRVRQEAARREARLRAELETIAVSVGRLTEAAETLADRIALALAELGEAHGGEQAADLYAAIPMVIVAHGVPSAAGALSLQRFVASLPQVASVTAREFAGGVLRLDARARDRLLVDQFRGWEPSRRLEVLTEREDVVEFALVADSG